MQLVVVTGLSGSGKSIALDVLEDAGYYCVDNLPAHLLPDLIGFLETRGHTRAAASIDVRSGDTLGELPAHIDRLRTRGVDARLVFLDATTETLVKRFSETRRRHPLSQGERTVSECIEREREQLADVAGMAYRFDTSELSPNTLRGWIKDFVAVRQSGLTLIFESFGFKHGIPLDADLVFDVRCLPNPHYDPRLRPLTGGDPEVVAFLEADPAVRRMYTDIQTFVAAWLPSYIRDNRSYLTVALGCTGGRHRSVYLAEALARDFEGGQPVLVRHRELAAGEATAARP